MNWRDICKSVGSPSPPSPPPPDTMCSSKQSVGHNQLYICIAKVQPPRVYVRQGEKNVNGPRARVCVCVCMCVCHLKEVGAYQNVPTGQLEI